MYWFISEVCPCCGTHVTVRGQLLCGFWRLSGSLENPYTHSAILEALCVIFIGEIIYARERVQWVKIVLVYVESSPLLPPRFLPSLCPSFFLPSFLSFSSFPYFSPFYFLPFFLFNTSSPYSLGWLWIHNLPSSAFQVSGWQTCTTRLGRLGIDFLTGYLLFS